MLHRMKKRPQYRRTFIREWRKHRQLTLEQLSSRLEELGQGDLGPSALSMLERGQRAYTQQSLEALANALQTDVASLLMRNPTDPEAIWSVWDNAQPGERRMIVEIAKTVVKRAS
jgi:transcriptional regulator with XRE-family HTH domain